MSIKQLIYNMLAKVLRRNVDSTPPSVILNQMNERRPLPVGIAEFDVWSDRIISGTLLPADNDSMKFALSTMLLHLGPQEDHREDAYFIHSLRKSAVNQIAHAKMKELKDAATKRLEELQAQAQDKAKESTMPIAEATLKRAESLKLVPNQEGSKGEVLAKQEV